MKQMLKAVVGAVTIAGLLGSAGVAQAALIAGASSAAFMANAPSEAPFINRTLGRYVTNDDTVSAHNAVADLGIVVGSGSAPIVNVYADVPSSSTLTCWAIAVHLASSNSQAPGVGWTGNPSAKQITGLVLNSGQKYALSIFCSIPPQGAFGNTKIFGASVDI
ncbi:MAG TPA: hypothetical protein VJV79_36605 [Polyangiaceae bacterium]|nr:hypothetical protein [Polyangiaceae bacterium]